MKKKIKRKSAKELDRDAMREEDASILAIIGFTILFVLIGLVLGYILYKLALNSSAMIVSNIFI